MKSTTPSLRQLLDKVLVSSTKNIKMQRAKAVQLGASRATRPSCEQPEKDREMLLLLRFAILQLIRVAKSLGQRLRDYLKMFNTQQLILKD
jgi:hypothetical protein